MPAQTQIGSKPAKAKTNSKADTHNSKPTYAKSVSVPASTRPEASERVHAARNRAPTSVQPVEPEDAYLTGVSRSLQRRLLGLNVEGSHGQAKPHPEAAAGQHATGSFTGPESVPARAPKGEKKKKA